APGLAFIDVAREVAPTGDGDQAASVPCEQAARSDRGLVLLNKAQLARFLRVILLEREARTVLLQALIAERLQFVELRAVSRLAEPTQRLAQTRAVCHAPRALQHALNAADPLGAGPRRPTQHVGSAVVQAGQDARGREGPALRQQHQAGSY